MSPTLTHTLQDHATNSIFIQITLCTLNLSNFLKNIPFWVEIFDGLPLLHLSNKRSLILCAIQQEKPSLSLHWTLSSTVLFYG